MSELKKRGRYNVILGIIVGFILAQLVIAEGYAFLAAKEMETGMDYFNIKGLELNTFKALAVIVFVITVLIFNTKRFKRINFNKIGIYLIFAVLISIIVSFEGIVLLGQIFFKLVPDFVDNFDKNYFLLINASGGVVVFTIAIFLTTYILLVNKKVNYIKFLTKEVKVIKDEGFGKVIKVKGGDELSELCQSINDMSVELGERIKNERKIENNKNELITNISHDLKTPLTSIIGYLEILNKKEIDEKDREEYIRIAYNKSLRLKLLVNELFEYTKLVNSDIKFEKRKVNISKLLNQVVGESIINFDEKNINVILNNPYDEVFCNVDAAQILRVFDNLIKNAEKYSDDDSVFKVTMTVENGVVLISFINKCAGLKEENIENLFERFYRNDKSRSKEGSGLGLPIAKRIIELHDGNIYAEKENENIKFNIKLQSIA